MPPAFKMENVDCLRQFSPDPTTETTYLITLWTSQSDAPTASGYNKLQLSYKIGSGNSNTLSPVSSAVIDGWQRNEYKMTINPGTSLLPLEFKNSTGSQTVYVDDIRIQPDYALVKAYVYDYRTQRLMAELDENHFATFYEYDEDGKMVRLKKETERGVMTISETRYHSVKK